MRQIFASHSTSGLWALACACLLALTACHDNPAAAAAQHRCDEGKDARSCFTYAKMQAKGQIVTKDMKKAKTYLEKGVAMAKASCLKNNVDDCHLLGARLFVGTASGLKANPKKAQKYFKKACEGGSKRSCVALEQLKRNFIKAGQHRP